MLNLYVIGSGEEGCSIKIGVANDVKKRLTTLQTGNPKKIGLLKIWELNEEEAKLQEDFLHDYFRHTKLNGEWFKSTPFMMRYFDNLYIEDGKLLTKDPMTLEKLFGMDVYAKISDSDHQIQVIARQYREDGNFHAIEHIVEELKQTIRIITGRTAYRNNERSYWG